MTCLGQRAGKVAIVTGAGSGLGRGNAARAVRDGATKAGVVALTHALARELGPHGIRVNCVSPGNMATDTHWAARRRQADISSTTFEETRDRLRAAILLGRHGEHKDIGALVSFLASDAAYITGQTINVAGGFQPR